MNNISLSNLTYFLPLTCVGFVYFALIIWVLPQDSFFTPDSGIKFIQLKEMIKQGDLTPAIEYPGRKIDKNLKFQPYSWLVTIKDNKVYSHYSPVYPWLTSFFYRKFGAIGLYVISALAGFLSLVIMLHFSRYFVNESVALLSSIVLGLGTPIFIYSLVYWEHTLAFVLSVLIILIAMRIIEGARKTLLVLPPLIILCIWIRSETAPFIMAILLAGVLLFWKNIVNYGKVLWTGLAVFFLACGAFIGFNLLTTDTFWGIHISRHLFNFRTIDWFILPSIQRVKIITTLLGRSARSPECLEYVTTAVAMTSLLISFSTVFFARFGELRHIKIYGSRWSSPLIVISIVAIVTTTIINLFSDNIIVGLFQVTPFVIFALFSFLADSEDINLRFIKIVTIIYFIFILFMPTKGGMQWGPRYIIYIYPLLIILCWDGLATIKKKFSQDNNIVLKTSCILLIIFSFILQIKGIGKLYSMKKRNMEIETIVAAEPTNVIVSGFEHYLAYYAPGLYNKKMFFNASNANVSELIKKFYERGITKFSVTSDRSMVNKLKIGKSNLINLRIPDKKGGYKRIYPISEKYRDENHKNGLVLTVFEMR